MSTPQVRTGPQVTAADPKVSVWVSANAGTGKTQVLTDRITRLLLEGVRPERILCLTFTKAAAAEMATRLSERLGAWAVAGENDLKAEISALLGKPPEDDLLAPARRLFAETLDVPGGLKIRTIHAFCESLLGRFPVEAGIAPHFSVIDERTAAELMAEARNHLLGQAVQENSGDVTRALRLMATLLNEEDFTRLMTDLSSKRSHLRGLFIRHGSAQGVIEAARRAMGLKQGESAQSIIEEACKDACFDTQALMAAAEALLQGTPKERKLAAAFQAFLKSDISARCQQFEDVYQLVFLTKTNTGRKTLMTKKIAEAHPDGLQAMLDEQTRLITINERIRAARIFQASEALIHIGLRLLDTFENLKEARALLDYDDLILKARDLLQTEGGASWVHYKLDGGLDHILVDEAQDTSPEQWDVIKELAGDFFAGVGAREGERTVFAVGDEKQSIYSFQGADPFMFGHMSDFFKNLASNAGKVFSPVELERSYRSTKSVLRTVDDVFSHDTARQGLTFNNKPITHHWARDGQAGLVELWPTMKPGEAIEVKPWDAPIDRVALDSPEDRMARRIADTISGWRESGEELASAGRPIREGDIMILVRQRGSFAEKMVNTLKQRGIPVAGADRMVLTEQLAVMDLIALGRFLLLPEDDLTLAVVLKGPLFGFNDNNDLFPLCFERPGTLWAALKAAAASNPKYAEADERLSEFLGRADFMPPFEFYARLLGPEGGRRQLLAHLGTEADDPIDEFLGLALDYEREHVPSLQGFLSWIEAGRTQIKRDLEMGQGKVRVMTVHGSKGLQGNIVFLPDTCSVPKAQHEPKLRWVDDPEEALLWAPHKDQEESLTAALSEEATDKRAQEYRRLLYVAMTRARDRLYIGGWEGKNKPHEDCWYNLIETAFEGVAQDVTLASGETVLRVSNQQDEKPDGKPEDDVAGPGTPVTLPDWALQPPAAEPEPSTPLSPSRLSEDNEPTVRSPFDGDDGDRFKRGTLIHRLLESLPSISQGLQRAAAAKYLSRPIHSLDADQQNAITDEVMAVLENPEFATLFGPDSLAEVPISGTIGGRSVSARIDRLAITDDEITIIDYKTNRPPPINPDGVAPAYLGQMALYRALLRLVYPGRPVSCILAWTDGPRLMSLPDDILDQYAP
ncbi:MAG: double-strand break repair helicase AddA [Rhodospirillales bacterium]|nr:double-strand break repair helicase AddA [Rhodospirillales bacterium]